MNDAVIKVVPEMGYNNYWFIFAIKYNTPQYKQKSKFRKLRVHKIKEVGKIKKFRRK